MTEYQKKWGIVLLCVWVLGWLLVAEVCKAEQPKGASRNRVDVAVWLAQSIVGECGWKCAQTGEGAAIAWIYFKRSYNHHRRDYFRAMFDYSAALRVGYKTRPWLRQLNRSGKRPRLLETNTAWSRHQKYWFKTLALADEFFEGKVKDTCPNCLHFGGVMDVKNMNPAVWKKVDVPFRNKFWEKRD
jgi:hypothetical protein